MNRDAPKPLDPLCFMAREEIRRVLEYLDEKQENSINFRQNKVIFRLATCCGLRASEIVGLNIGDIRTGDPPHIRIRPETAKRGSGRIVPLYLDGDTFRDISSWKSYRVLIMHAGDDDPLVCCITDRPQPFANYQSRRGCRLHRRWVLYRFKTCLRVLGPERKKQLRLHDGRHTFASVCLNEHVPLTDLQHWLGHKDLKSTQVYAHTMLPEKIELGEMFSYKPI